MNAKINECCERTQRYVVHWRRISAANADDSTQLLPLIDAIPSIIGLCGRPGRPRKRRSNQHRRLLRRIHEEGALGR